MVSGRPNGACLSKVEWRDGQGMRLCASWTLRTPWTVREATRPLVFVACLLMACFLVFLVLSAAALRC